MGRAKPGKANNLSKEQRDRLEAFLDPDQTEHLKKIRTENMTIDSAAAYCTRVLDFGAVVTPSNYRNALRKLKRVHKDRKDEWGNITVIQQFTEIEKRDLGNKDKFRRAVNQYNRTVALIIHLMSRLPYVLKTKYSFYVLGDVNKDAFLNCMDGLSDFALEWAAKMHEELMAIDGFVPTIMTRYIDELKSIRFGIPIRAIISGQNKKHAAQEIANNEFKMKSQLKID